MDEKYKSIGDIRDRLIEELCHICKRPKKEVGGQFCSAAHPIPHDCLIEEIYKTKSQCADELEEITKLYVLKDKDLDSLIKKWREK